MRKAAYISFVIGCSVATILAIVWRVYWHLVDVGRISVTASQYYRFSDISSCLFPSSMLLMEVDPRAPVTIQVLVLYAAAILLNGMLYAFVVLALGKIGRALGRAVPSRQ